MSFFRLAIFIVFCLAAGTDLLAQPPIDVFQWEEPYNRFYEKGQRDSFLYYSDLKAQLCHAADSLALWAWVGQTAAEFLSDRGEEDAAQQRLEATLSDRWRMPKNAAEWEPFCYILANRGSFFAQNGWLLKSLKSYEEAALRYEQFRYLDFDAVEFIYKPLGNGYTRLGDNDKALAVFFKTLMLGADNDAMAGVYCNIGIAYWNKGDGDAAEKYHRQGLALPEVSALKRALLLGALAQTLLDKGQAQQAARSADESLRLLAREKPSGVVLEYRCYSRRTAGEACMRLGQLSDAAILLAGAHSDALAVFGNHSRDLGKIEITRAELFLLQGKAGLTMDAANRALSAVLNGFQAVRPEQNPNSAIFYEENVIFNALTTKAAAAQKLFEKTDNIGWLTLALECHDLAWMAETRLRKIFQYSSSKLELQNSTRARETAAMRIVRLLYEKTRQQRYLDKAFFIAERSKASLLGEAIRDNLVRQRLAESDRRFSELSQLRQNYSSFEKQLLLHPESKLLGEWRNEADVLSTRINHLETEIDAAYPQLAAQHIATASEVSDGLQPGETVMEYFVGTEYIEAFVFQKGKTPRWLSIPNTVDLQAITGQFLAYFENQNTILNDPGGYLTTAYLLWQKLLPKDMSTATTLTIVPDGFLNTIPFDALVVTKPASTTSLRNADYLLRQQQVRYAWSLSVLHQQKELVSKAKNYALCLVPGFSKGERGLSPLQSPAGERPSDSKVLQGESADLQHFMADASLYRVLHLSTHAFATAQDGQLPRLELYDQPLYLPSIYALSLQADLVTLSACQTGLGHTQSGEGVMSLARAFAQAGAACVVSSLWSVNDHSMSALLAGFYKNLEDGNTIGQSLRAAKLGYLNDESVRGTMQSPYFWAGLVMVGDDRGCGGGNRDFAGVLLILLVLFLGCIWALKSWKKHKRAVMR